MLQSIETTQGARLVRAQDACALFIDGKVSTQEHFGYKDGFGNPDFKGAERRCTPGQGKLDENGDWQALATGEFLLGYADEAGENRYDDESKILTLRGLEHRRQPSCDAQEAAPSREQSQGNQGQRHHHR